MNSIRRGTIAMALLISMVSVRAKADSTREFMMSAAYGTLAGTIVGAATLAFSDKPGDNLNKVARGASLGLYAGILLGIYVAYGGPSEDSDAAEQLRHTSIKAPDLLVAPIIGDRGLEGAQASYSVLHF
jgi:hypothetical protein